MLAKLLKNKYIIELLFKFFKDNKIKYKKKRNKKGRKVEIMERLK